MLIHLVVSAGRGVLHPVEKGIIIETTIQATVLPTPRIGDKARAFEAVTMQGEIAFPEQYAGSWAILVFHPADFTPVCTSEFMTFASLDETFEKASCKLAGLSLDGLYSRIAAAKNYGMIQPGESSTKAVRAVFVIDPKGIIRTIICYPLSLGPNFDQLCRVVLALQTADPCWLPPLRTGAPATT
jgi:peroxiredoxin (alkyl hydroperoxide reductase subunit C)